MKCEFATEGLLWIDKIATGVGIILFNPQNKLAAGVHILRGLSQGRGMDNPAYYADTALGYVIDEFKKRGADRQISVAIAGGSAMLGSGEGDNIGTRLVATIKTLLSGHNLSVKLEGVGGTKLRTMILNIDEGKIKIS
jgi:chemotaxis receptor (MCP) glutamine deamidase CheD